MRLEDVFSVVHDCVTSGRLAGLADTKRGMTGRLRCPDRRPNPRGHPPIPAPAPLDTVHAPSITNMRTSCLRRITIVRRALDARATWAVVSGRSPSWGSLHRTRREA